MRIRPLLMSLALLGLATPARADWFSTGSFLDRCSSGAIRTCASFQVTTMARSGGGQWVWLSVRNLQGTLGADNTGGSLITRVGLTAPDLQGVGNLSVTTSGGASEVKDASDYWKILSDGNGGSIGGQVTFSTGTTGTDGGILGCDRSDAKPDSYFQTCGDKDVVGDEGWVVFSFTTTNNWDAADGQVAWRVQAVTADGNSYVCRTDSDCSQVAVTPEPASMALLSGGLLGLGYLRRRKISRPEIGDRAAGEEFV